MEAIEDIARALGLPKLMLCSTNDPVVKSTWHHLNFDFASEEEMAAWDIPHADLVYLQNTTQVSGGLLSEAVGARVGARGCLEGRAEARWWSLGGAAYNAAWLSLSAQ